MEQWDKYSEITFSAPSVLIWKKAWGEIENSSRSFISVSMMVGVPEMHLTTGSGSPAKQTAIISLEVWSGINFDVIKSSFKT